MVDKKVQDHLAKQDASTVDATKLTALTPEVVSVEYIAYIVVFVCDVCLVVEDFLFVYDEGERALRKFYCKEILCISCV